MPTLRLLIYVWIALLTGPVAASVSLPGDSPYYRFRKDRTLYIYDAGARELINQLAAYTESVRAMYDESYGWSLDEEMDLILLSPRQQIPNGYATVIPNLKTVWYPSGVGALEEMAESSWLLTLASHETAHLYQLNAKGPLNAGLKRVLGNALVFVPFAWGIVIHPNILTPTFLVEGNAVLNESRLNMGGRLFSGEKRALVLAQIREGLIDPRRLINDELVFPFGEESYMQGAYFQAHLAAKYGIEKTNRFFVAQGNRYLWPLILNKTFREHFGESYPQEIREYVRGLETLAQKQKSSDGTTLIETLSVSPLNHDENRVFFLTSRLREPPILQVFDKRTGQLEGIQRDLPMGKVFWQGAEAHTATTFPHSIRYTEYSLYGDGGRLDPRFRGQIVTDRRAGKTVALDATNAWLDPRLLVDGAAFDVAHSGGVLDDTGNVYYFRQNGGERMLYRNREPLMKFDGFYAKPMEVTADGMIYFIGSTDTGSTLFRTRGKEIVRVLASDRVVDARALGGDRFLIVEVGAHGYKVQLATAEPKPENPATYSYGFTTQSLIPARAVDASEVAQSERSYSAWRELRYSSLNLGTYWSDSSGLGTSAALVLTDPMEHHALGLAANWEELGDDEYLASYTYTKFVPDFYISYLYEEDAWERPDGLKLNGFNQTTTVGAVAPLWRHRRWDAQGGLGLTYEIEDELNEERYGSLTSLALRYQIAPPLAFRPWRELLVTYTNRLESADASFTKRDNTSLVAAAYTHGFARQFFGQLVGQFAWAETHDISVDYDPYTLSQEIRIPRLTSHNEEWSAKTVGSLRVEFTRAFNTPAAGARIPVGLSRVAPLVVAQGIFLDDDRADRYPASTFEWGYGADLELLLFHSALAQVRLLNAIDTRYPDKPEQEARLTFKRLF